MPEPSYVVEYHQDGPFSPGEVVYVTGENSKGEVLSVDEDSVIVRMFSDDVAVAAAHAQTFHIGSKQENA